MSSKIARSSLPRAAIRQTDGVSILKGLNRGTRSLNYYLVGLGNNEVADARETCMKEREQFRLVPGLTDTILGRSILVKYRISEVLPESLPARTRELLTRRDMVVRLRSGVEINEGRINAKREKFGIKEVEALLYHFVRDLKGSGLPLQQVNNDSSLEDKFFRLLHEVRTDTALSSCPTDVFEHPSLRQIIEMGERVLPLVFLELIKPNAGITVALFFAARKITGESPSIPEKHRYDMRAKRLAWLEWAVDRGYI